jgi:predicted nucleotidyltransferase
MIRIDEKILKRLARKYGFDLVVLFGSQANRRTRAQSDTDIAVRLRPGRVHAASMKFELAGALEQVFLGPPEVDLVFLNEASSLLLFQVATTGRPLYERQPLLFWQFQSYAARRYDDDFKYRRRRDAYLERRVKQWNREKARSSARS